jgi:hypothetical protein
MSTEKDPLSHCKYPQGIVCCGDAHHRNLHGMMLACHALNISFRHVKHMHEALQLAASSTKWDFFWFACEPIPHQSLSLFAHKKVMYGPHFFVFPDPKSDKTKCITKQNNIVFNCLSKWNHVVHEEFGGVNAKIVTCPFGVDLHMFRPSERKKEKPKVFIYYKQRSETDLLAATSILERYLSSLVNEGKSVKDKDESLTIVILKYGEYKAQQYLELLQESQFGIWIGCHESQGFALEEALACNVSLLVWDAQSMFDECDKGSCVYSQYKGKKELKATSVPYWDEKQCGMKVDTKEQMEAALPIFHTLVLQGSFSPRRYVETHLSPIVCLERMLNSF